MAYFGETYKLIYNRVWNLVSDDSSLDFFKTKQKAFFPKQEDLLHPSLYPWLFLADGGSGETEAWRAPRHWQNEFSVLIVYLTHAKLFETNNMVFSDDPTVNGVGDIRILLETLFWGSSKVQDFGIPGGDVNDWTMGKTGDPTALNVQRIAMSEFVQAQQMELIFKVNKRDS